MKSDIVILGGGLAGLTLALQVSELVPTATIKVLERRRLPVPVSAHKVGESTVEIGAHYLAETLGLKEHLDREHLQKYGLRLFFGAGRGDDLAAAGELGASHLLALKSYQIDRGVLENHLAERVRAAGIELLDDCTVRDCALDGDPQPHQVSYRCGDQEHSIKARWVVDAMSRNSVIKRRLGLAESNDHHGGSVWFRIADRIDIGQWSRDPQWRQRCSQLPRWQSTNHLMGPGYWVWLIPLASGSTSIGVVFDTRMHDFDRLKTYSGTLAWLAEHQPLCHRAIEASSGERQDFLCLRRYSHGCRQVFSADRWALTGEAGVFLDPFYSPGSDFIAISNTYIADLIRRDMEGESIKRRARLYERRFFSFYESSLNLYRDQYPLFGHARSMSAKTIWDYAYYWSVLALFVFSGRLTDLSFLARHGARLDQLRQLNVQIQAMFREWADVEAPMVTEGLFVNQSDLPLLVRLNRELAEVAGDTDDQLDQRLTRNVRRLRRLAGELRALAPQEVTAGVDLHTDTEDGRLELLTGLPPSMIAGVPSPA